MNSYNTQKAAALLLQYVPRPQPHAPVHYVNHTIRRTLLTPMSSPVYQQFQYTTRSFFVFSLLSFYILHAPALLLTSFQRYFCALHVQADARHKCILRSTYVLSFVRMMTHACNVLLTRTRATMIFSSKVNKFYFIFLKISSFALVGLCMQKITYFIKCFASSSSDFDTSHGMAL